MPSGIEAQVAGILARIGRIDTGLLMRETDLAGLGLDSVTMVEAIFALEEAFDIEVPYATAPGPVSFGTLVDQIAGLVQAQA